MFDTYLTIIGNVLTAPEWRRTSQSHTLVANFKVASTARRLHRESGQWVDGHSLRVRVTCWRRLAEGVASSVMVGDPVVVVGRLYTRDWSDTEGNPRVAYEMEAVAVGHDLSRGRARFARNRPTAATSAVEDDEAESRVRGEATEAVPEAEAPTRHGDHPFDDIPDPDFGSVPISSPSYDALAEMRGGREFDEDLDPLAIAATVPADADDDDDDDDGDDLDEAEEGDGDKTADGLSVDMLPGDGAEPDLAAVAAGAGLTESDGGLPETGAPGEPARGRRGRSRTPVPA
ncbi:single-stranded DNA-binding protein [Phytohabitans sp. ZYX-F-186]|uniref:Single-stranded DNA-binding protein n=1 Tax=Phytohabitans maris TaxID=3071409 RepID=A0ABU0ZN22_9ACTN|nr:single-stranded DNA-binding protein [Phytohabitans sp. ZYX-F-186]MDQ7907779.1 single-stranded DNA-binding protein [Phytohabitans sp. ZYX-F-186]